MMKIASATVVGVLVGAAALLSVGCGSGGVDLAAVCEEGRMVIELDGQEIPLRVATMNIYLVDPEEEHRYPEVFHVNGPDVDLVGTFPMNLRVGYGADYSKMVGKTVSVAPRQHVQWQERSSAVKALGIAGDVRGGSLVIERVLGQNPEGAGQVLQGQVTLELADRRQVAGTFTLLAVTWG